MDNIQPFLISLIVGLCIFFIILFLLSRLKKSDEKHMERLNNEIITKKQMLHEINKQIEDQTFDRTTKLTKTQMDVLDIYDQSNIRIPADIIEDLSYSRINDYQDIIEYIENQRNYWKLENTKKPYRKKV